MTVRRAAVHPVTDSNSHTRASSQTLESSLLSEGRGCGGVGVGGLLADLNAQLLLWLHAELELQQHRVMQVWLSTRVHGGRSAAFSLGFLLGVISRLWLVDLWGKKNPSNDGRETK